MAYLENLIREICAPQKGFSIYCKPTFSGNNFISLFIGDKLVAKTTFCDQALKKKFNNFCLKEFEDPHR